MKFWREKKKDSSKSVESWYTGGYTWKECQHDNFLKLGKGKLYGLNGYHHRKSLANYDLNVLLAYPPEGMLLSTPGLLDTLDVSVPAVLFYEIKDRNTPENKAPFARVVAEVEKALKQGKSVAVSCMGGHGRTGLLLAIVYGELTSCETPIQNVREQICSKLVESWEQEAYVHEWLSLPTPQKPKPVWVPPLYQDTRSYVDLSKDRCSTYDIAGSYVYRACFFCHEEGWNKLVNLGTTIGVRPLCPLHRTSYEGA